MAVAGEQPDGTPYVMRLRHGRWSRPSVPPGGTDGGRYLTSVAWTPRGVTAVGYAEGATGPPGPMLLTGGR